MMAAILTRQYRPVAARLTEEADAPLSVHAVRELCDATNNAKAYAMAHKMRGVICFPKWVMASALTEERVQFIFAPIKVPDGYKVVRWHIGHERSSGTGSDAIVLRIRSVGRLYVGPDAYDGTYCGPGSTTYSSLVVNSDLHSISTGALSIPYSDDTVYLMITAQAVQSGTKARLTTLDFTPRLS